MSESRYSVLNKRKEEGKNARITNRGENGISSLSDSQQFSSIVPNISSPQKSPTKGTNIVSQSVIRTQCAQERIKVEKVCRTFLITSLKFGFLAKFK